MTEVPASQMPRPAWRLFLAFEGEEIQPATYYQLKMLVPPSDSLESLEGYSGSWFQLEDAHGRPLYRRVVYDLFGALPDLHQDDDPVTDSVDNHNPTGQPSEEADPQKPDLLDQMPDPPFPAGEFSLLVPVLEEAVRLSIYSSPPNLHEFTYPAQRIADFSLEEFQQMQED